jgi:outer membrane protein assembly factor BamB
MSFRAFVVLSVAGALTVVGGCKTVSESYDRLFSSGKPAQPPSELVSIKPTATPKILWQGAAGASDKSVFYPAPAGNLVYAASAAGDVTAFDAVKGGAVSEVPGRAAHLGRSRRGGRVVVRRHAARLKCSPSNRRAGRSGKRSSPARSWPRPLAQDGVVVARSGDGRIYGLDTATGKRRWVYQRPTQVP